MSKKYKQEAPIKVPRFKESEGFYTTRERSRIMAKIKGKDTKSELRFRQELHRAGVRFRVHAPTLPGNPDVSNIRRKFVVFIDGEFWHGYDWESKKQKLKSNREFWIPKIERNMQRDQEVNARHAEMDFKVFRFWEREVKKNLKDCVAQVLACLAERGQP